LSIACTRLMRLDARWYARALRANTRAAAHLQRLTAQDPEASRLQQVLLRVNFETALCHWSAGRQEEGETAFQTGLSHLDRLLESLNVENIEKVYLIGQLLDVASKLRETRQIEWGLAVTREAAVRTANLAKTPIRDRETSTAMAAKMHAVATLLAQLGQAHEAIPLFKNGLRLFQRLSEHIPDNISCFQGISDAHVGMGKAFARINQSEDSMKAFHAAAAVGSKLVERFPDVLTLRISLSRSYDRLHDYAVRFEKRSEAAAALRQRARLWPGNRAELSRVARNFQELARMFDRARRDLTTEERAENQQFLEESEQFVQEAARLDEKSPKRRLAGGTIEMSVK
jgi:tetratricopeptide (TPR) repeat protein